MDKVKGPQGPDKNSKTEGNSGDKDKKPKNAASKDAVDKFKKILDDKPHKKEEHGKSDEKEHGGEGTSGGQQMSQVYGGQIHASHSIMHVFSEGKLLNKTEGVEGKHLSGSEVKDLAAEMAERVLATDPKLNKGLQQAKITLKGEHNPSLKDVDIIVKTKTVDGDKQKVSVEFDISKNPSSYNLLHNAQESLVAKLKDQLPQQYEVKETVDFHEAKSDTEGHDQGQSRGEYIPEEDE